MKKAFIISLFILVVSLSSCTKVPEYTLTLAAGKDIIHVSEEWIDNGCTIILEDTEYDMVLENEPNVDVPGTYNLYYRYSTENHKFTCERVVKVEEMVLPDLSLNPGVDTIKVDESHIDASITVNNYDENQYTLIVVSNVNTEKKGTYEITYTVTSVDGYSNIITRKVNVVD